jgi:hypothetical protein
LQATPQALRVWDAEIDRARDDLGGWFDATMDRVSQHFASHLRVWTIGFSLVVALLFQLDAVALFRRLSSDAELRTVLVANVESLRNRAEAAQSGTNAVPPLQTLLTTTLANAGVGFRPVLTELEKIPAFPDLPAATNWVMRQVQALGAQAPAASEVERALAAFQRDVALSPFHSAMHRFQTTLQERTVVMLIPDPFLWPWQGAFWTAVRSHLAGILVSTIFLSLGAPFWFNLLKTLSTLRPILANKQQAERRPDAGAR